MSSAPGRSSCSVRLHPTVIGLADGLRRPAAPVSLVRRPAVHLAAGECLDLRPSGITLPSSAASALFDARLAVMGRRRAARRPRSRRADRPAQQSRPLRPTAVRRAASSERRGNSGPRQAGEDALRWRRHQAEGVRRWAVKVPFEPERGRGAARRPRSRRRRTPRACRRRRCGGPTTAGVRHASTAARSGCTSGSTCSAPDPTSTRRWSAPRSRRPPGASRPPTADRTPGTANRSAPTAGTSWSSSCATRGAVRRSAGRPARRARRAGVVDRAAGDAADLPPRPVGRQRPADRRRRRVRHRLGEQRAGRPEPGARLRAVRVRPRRPGPGPGADRRLPRTPAGRRRSTGAATSRCSSPSSATSPRSPPPTGWSPTPAHRTGPTPPRGSARCSTSRTRRAVLDRLLAASRTDDRRHRLVRRQVGRPRQPGQQVARRRTRCGSAAGGRRPCVWSTIRPVR